MPTKRERMRNWCLTANHKGDKERGLLDFFQDKGTNKELLWPKEISNFIIFQVERGEEGTAHIQAYIELKKAMELKPLINYLNETHNLWKGCHIEVSKREKASIVYCAKHESRLLGPWTFGKVKEQGKRSDLLNVAETIKDNGLKEAIIEHPDMYIKYNRGMEKLADFYAQESAEWCVPNVHIYYGETGTGKTKAVYDIYKYNEVARAMYQKDSDGYKVWFQNYNYQPCILFDEFSDNKCPLDLMKIYTDGHPCDLNIKGGSKLRTKCKDIFIITNKNPKDFYPTANDIDMRAFVRRITSIKWFKSSNEVINLAPRDVFNHWYNGTEVAEG